MVSSQHIKLRIYSIYDNTTTVMSELLSDDKSTFSISNLSKLLHWLYELNSIGCYNTAPGVPYQVVVVAFTSAGKGAENDLEVFFSQELTPTKVPPEIDVVRLNLAMINVTWSLLTLVEAGGFPHYRVTLMPLSYNNRIKRQMETISMETNASYLVFHSLVSTTAYSVVVGVRTGSSDLFMDAEFITGRYIQCTHFSVAAY